MLLGGNTDKDLSPRALLFNKFVGYKAGDNSITLFYDPVVRRHCTSLVTTLNSEIATDATAAERIKVLRFRIAVSAMVFSLTTKLVPMGSFTWLAKGYGHDCATPVFAYMLTRSHFSSSALCAAVTFLFFVLSEAFQFFQFLIPGHSPGQPRFGIFDPWDIFAFTLGTTLAFGIDSLLTRRSPHRP